MSNCREIEVAVLLPLSESYSTSSLSSTFGIDERLNGNSGIEVEGSQEKKLRANAKMDADQEHHTADLSLTENTNISSHDPSTPTKQPEAEQKDEAFRFLDLPLELRLKIYGHLLPARHHTVATQIPHNGSFYNTSTIPSHSAQSFYPFGISAPIQKLTTYKVLTGNFRNDFPGLSMFPEVLRVNKQIHEEAEGVLYGSKDTVWDFGTYVDAAIAFWGDRSVDARRSVKSIRVAREMPAWLGRNAYGNEREDASWVRFCDFVKQELKGLQTLDLTLWSSTGSAASFPTRIPGSQAQAEGERDEDEETERKRKEQEETEMKWREYNYTASLLSTPALRSARITWWGFNSEAGNGVEENGGASDRSWGGSKKGFDSWIATRMVGDELVKDRMVREGVVVEDVVVVRGGDA
ncbi:uncharacterized protein PAC_11605 [Phialocephala subalpina]|uniref:F-box domain-containing protein n=1 Tax=Phialocephala subalpina TaxID=576137 RepID=A0A1L7X9J2_9HELO|nr:uncharacterized protein PAC_11605 [Phialocephala subalpina]